MTGLCVNPPSDLPLESFVLSLLVTVRSLHTGQERTHLHATAGELDSSESRRHVAEHDQNVLEKRLYNVHAIAEKILSIELS